MTEPPRDDPVATTLATFHGALAAAIQLLGREDESAEDVLFRSGEALRTTVEAHLDPRLPPPEDQQRLHVEALEALGVAGDVRAVRGAEAALELRREVARAARAGFPSVVYGLRASVFSVVIGAHGETLVARSFLEPSAFEVAESPAERGYAAILRGLTTVRAPEPARVAARALAAAEPVTPRQGVSRGLEAYAVLVTVIRSHPLSRLSPAGLAWKVAELEEARLAASRGLRALGLEPPAEAFSEEARLLAAARLRFPFPDGGRLTARDVDEGARDLARASAAHRRGLELLAGTKAGAP